MGKKMKKQLPRIPKEIKASKYASKESNAMTEHIETPFEDIQQVGMNNANESNCENADAENIGNAPLNNAMPTNPIIEDAMEIDRNAENVNANPIQNKTRKTRGPTKVKRLPSNAMNRIEVEFNGQVEPIGPGLVKLSSFLGPLVREHVPVTLSDWRHLPEDLKIVLWKSIQRT